MENLLVTIESKTLGDGVKMGTTTVPTFEPAAAPPAGAPEKVRNLRASDGDGTDDLDVMWDSGRPRRYRGFVVRMCEEPYNQANMQVVGMPSASKLTKSGLLLGHTCWFEVVAQGSGDVLGPWSDPAKATVG